MRDTRSGLNLPFAMVFAALIALGLISAAVYFSVELLSPPPAERTDPVALLPREPEGVTIALKQPEPEPQAPAAAPVAAGAAAARGFAVDLGAAQSFSALSRRFAELAANNAELSFDRLEPRATLVDTDTGLQARLLVGPFGQAGEAETFCANIALPAEITCAPVPFAGELIARE